MAWQANNAHIMTEIFAAKLRANAKLSGELQDARFPCGITPAMSALSTLCWQIIKRFDRGHFHGLHGIFSRCAADDNRKMIGRASSGSQIDDGIFDKIHHRIFI